MSPTSDSQSLTPIPAQPTEPPGAWQLCGPSLGHLVLYTSDLSNIRARLPVQSHTRTAIGSGPRSTIRFNHPDCHPLHLRLSIASNHLVRSSDSPFTPLLIISSTHL